MNENRWCLFKFIDILIAGVNFVYSKWSGSRTNHPLVGKPFHAIGITNGGSLFPPAATSDYGADPQEEE